MVAELLATDHPLSEELMKYKFHSDAAVRELVIRLDIMMTSRKFAKLCHSATFMMPFYELSNKTRIRDTKHKSLSNSLGNLIGDFDVKDTRLPEIVADLLKDITEGLLLNVLDQSSNEYCEFLLDKILDSNISKKDFFEILDQSPMEDGTKAQLARLFEIARGIFENYDIKQILRPMCTAISLRDSSEDIDKLEAAQSIEQIKDYVSPLLTAIKQHLHVKNDELLLKSISKYKTHTVNAEWRKLLEAKVPNIPSMSKIERDQHTILVFSDIRNMSKTSLVANSTGANLLKLNFALRPKPNDEADLEVVNYRTILEEAESRDSAAYKILVLAAARQIIQARSEGLEGLARETQEAIPDLVYILMTVAKTPEEKKLISDLTNGVLTAEKLEAESSRSLLSLFTDSREYTWIKKAFSWSRLEPLISKLEDLDLYLDNFRRLRSDLFNHFYSPTEVKKCILMNIPPSQLVELYSQNKTKLELLVNPIAIEGYKNKYWSFKELNELNSDDLTNLLKPESLTCIQSGFSLSDILDSLKNNDRDLHSENMQCLLKIGATKHIVELLRTYKPWMLKSLLKQSKEASENNKSFSDIYFHQGQGFMNPRTTPLPIVAGAGALLYRADSPGINLARIINRAVSRVDLEHFSSSPKPRRVRSTPDLQRTDQTEPQTHTI